MSNEKLVKLVRKAMKSEGFTNDSAWVPPNYEKICSYCQKTSSKKLVACAKCMKVFYCDSTCQKAHWKKEHHRFCCINESVRLQKFLEDYDGKEKSTMGKLPTEFTSFTEKSGIGTMTIIYEPGATSAYFSGSTLDFLPRSNDLVYMLDLFFKWKRSMIEFNGLNDIPPLVRFTISCGVLPDLNTAKDCVSDAIAAVRGNLENLRAPFARFTALEFAAKKGNTEIVKWLCTDDRTKGLVQIGCPIGWSLSTGQVEIARNLMEHGADPIKTDEVLFNHTPTLMVAAQNGKLESMKFLVQECGVDIAMLDQNGKDVLDHIKKDFNWRDMDSHKECHKWAKKLLNKR